MAPIPLPHPKKWNVVRCFLKYPHDKHAENTHPALVLHVVPAQGLGNSQLMVVVAGGTSALDPSSGRRRGIHRGEIPLSETLVRSAGLTKETKFCFSEEGVFAFPWDSDYFRCDLANPTSPGEPLFGSLDTKGKEFERFKTLFLDSPEFRGLNKTIENALRAAAQRPVEAPSSSIS